MELFDSIGRDCWGPPREYYDKRTGKTLPITITIILILSIHYLYVLASCSNWIMAALVGDAAPRARRHPNQTPPLQCFLVHLVLPDSFVV